MEGLWALVDCTSARFDSSCPPKLTLKQYILFNIAAACALVRLRCHLMLTQILKLTRSQYYLVRVPRPKMEETTKPEPTIESDAGSSQRSEKV